MATVQVQAGPRGGGSAALVLLVILAIALVIFALSGAFGGVVSSLQTWLSGLNGAAAKTAATTTAPATKAVQERAGQKPAGTGTTGTGAKERVTRQLGRAPASSAVSVPQTGRVPLSQWLAARYALTPAQTTEVQDAFGSLGFLFGGG